MRVRNAIISTIVAIGLVGLAAAPASAVEGDPYTPIDPDGPSIVGSTVTSSCVGDVPYIDYSVTLDDPEGELSNPIAWITMTGSGGSIDVPLGSLVDGKLSGSVLWPGAAVDGSGKGAAWPGWEIVNGEWAYTGGNLGWTRGDISAVLHVNPSLAIPLSYPTGGGCNPVAVLSDDPSDPMAQGLAATGGTAPYLALGLGAVAVAAGAFLLIRRRATR